MSANCCVFSGQGAQAPGMGKDFAEDSEIAYLFTRANDVLGFDLAKICFEGPSEELTKSDICQPAIFVVSTAAYQTFKKRFPNVKFSMAAGLSLGEWSALHAAGVLDFESTLKVLEARGRFMQEACEAKPSGMVSIMGATDDQLKDLRAKSGCGISNLNTASQTVLSGTREEVAACEAAAKEAGIKAIVLSVAGAFHSKFMAPAREKLSKVLDGITFNAPRMPVLANVSGTFHKPDPAAIKDAMLRQVTESVHWLDCMRTAIKAGAAEITEFGPGGVLARMMKRIDRGVPARAITDMTSIEAYVPRGE